MINSMTTGILSVVVIVFTFSFPESPRWLALKGRWEEARQVIAVIDDVEPDSEHVEYILTAIRSMNDLSGEKASFTSLFKYGKEKIVYRLLIASATQLFSQMSGSALITYYSEQLFSTVGLSHNLSKILGATDLTFKLICCAIPFFLIERAGRRKLLMIAASGMSTCMVSRLHIRNAVLHIDTAVLFGHLRFAGHRGQLGPRLHRHRFRLHLCRILPHRFPWCQLPLLARSHHYTIPSSCLRCIDRYPLDLCFRRCL